MKPHDRYARFRTISRPEDCDIRQKLVVYPSDVDSDPAGAFERFKSILDTFWPGLSDFCSDDDVMKLIRETYGIKWRIQFICKESLEQMQIRKPATEAFLVALQRSTSFSHTKPCICNPC